MNERNALEIVYRIPTTRPRCLEAAYTLLTGQQASAGDLRVLREEPFRIDSGTRIPDLLILHTPIAAPPTVVMIEAKTGSLEGADQTIDYSLIPECAD